MRDFISESHSETFRALGCKKGRIVSNSQSEGVTLTVKVSICKDEDRVPGLKIKPFIWQDN